MLEGLSHPLAEDIGRMYYAEGWSEDERWYLALEKRHGPEKMEDALLILAVVPNEQIANGALTILARKGDSRAVPLLSKIATDNLSPVREQAQWALGKIKERGIRSEDQVGKSEKGGEKKSAP